MKKYKYLEVKRFYDGVVVKRIDVSNHSDHNIEKIDSGINRNLNHEEYFTLMRETETELASTL